MGRLVEKLLPGIITTTTGARYFALHPLAWADAEGRGLDAGEASEFVRRCEVVVAAASYGHTISGSHKRAVPSAHGEGSLPAFIRDGQLDIAAAAKIGSGMSKGGFAGTYEAPERTIRLLKGTNPPTAGTRLQVVPLKDALGDVLELASQDSLSEGELTQIGHLCPCELGEASDGAWLRHLMFEDADPEVEGDVNRQVTGLMMLEALDGVGTTDPECAFRLTHGFGRLPEGDSMEATARRAWQAAILRNYSVSAWRHLWSWLSRQLSEAEMSQGELAARLSEALGGGSVRSFVDESPERITNAELLPAEEDLRDSDEEVPVKALRQLILGAERLDELDAESRVAYLGHDPTDLGPEWVKAQMEEHMNGGVDALARDLVATMLTRARRVAVSKMQMVPGEGPYVPTRLRERDGMLWMNGIEADAEVSLRGWTLTQVLTALGAVDRDGDVYTVTGLGEEMRETLRKRAGSAG